MKIAIQGHKSRGHEVIQILESLGGINRWDQTGRCASCAYYIDHVGNIYSFGICGYCGDREIYTLEEFEKEFPFKVGDKVRDCFDNEIGTILGFIDVDGELMYVVNFEKSGHTNMPAEELKPYKEMKEERNIKLTIDKAKEWYLKGGELKEIALQAFTEKELTKVDLPKTWEEFCGNYPIKEGESYAGDSSEIYTHYKSNGERDSELDRNMCPTPKSAEAHLAMIQLEQLRNCWWNGWEPIWDASHKWCIRLDMNELHVGLCTEISRFLTFPTREMAKEFLECFRDLIEKARDLI